MVALDSVEDSQALRSLHRGAAEVLWDALIADLRRRETVSSGMVVELHHLLAHPSAPYTFAVGDALREAHHWRNSQALVAMSTMDHFEFLCVHLFKESRFFFHVRHGSSERLSRYADIAAFANVWKNDLDWGGKVLRSVTERGLSTPVGCALRQTGMLFELPKEAEDLGESLTLDDEAWMDEFYSGNSYTSPVMRWKTPFPARVFQTDTTQEALDVLSARGTGGRPQVAAVRESEAGVGEGPPALAACTRVSEQSVCPLQQFGTHMQLGETPKSDADLSFHFGLAWSSSTLKVCARVFCKLVACGSANPRGFFYDRDAMRIYVGSSEGVRNLVVAPMGNWNDWCLLEQRFSGHKWEARVPLGSGLSVAPHDDGYSVVVVIPFEFIGITPLAGAEVLFDLEVLSCSSACDGVDRIMVWAGGVFRAPHDPSVLGSVVLS